MATASQVEAGLDAIATALSEQRAVMQKVKTNAQGASDVLGGLAALYADVISTINGYGTTNAQEALAKAKLAKFVTEFTALKADADAVAALNLDD